MPGLGRRHAPDPRDARFPLRQLIQRAPAQHSRYWKTGPPLNQGQTPTCVGHAWKNWLNAAPMMDKPDLPPGPFEIYHLAQTMDEWEGEAYEGTSVRAGVKAISSFGRLGLYHWSQDIQDAADYLLTAGPLVAGTNWSQSMFTPDHQGFVKYDPGNIAGGHAYLVYGYDGKRGAFRGYQTWGVLWGAHGRFWIPGEDFSRLLADDGELCAGTEIRPFN